MNHKISKDVSAGEIKNPHEALKAAMVKGVQSLDAAGPVLFGGLK